VRRCRGAVRAEVRDLWHLLGGKRSVHPGSKGKAYCPAERRCRTAERKKIADEAWASSRDVRFSGACLTQKRQKATRAVRKGAEVGRMQYRRKPGDPSSDETGLNEGQVPTLKTGPFNPKRDRRTRKTTGLYNGKEKGKKRDD